MAQYLKKHVSDLLATPLTDQTLTELPSPNSLKRKILLKDKTIAAYGKARVEGLQTMETQVNSTNPDLLRRLSPELSELIWCKSVKFQGQEYAEKYGLPWEISSFSELQIVKHPPAEMVKYNKVQFSRIYPKGARVDSSNYDPFTAWESGSQLVALNYQTVDKAMMVNLGWFLDNGNCGYVLKPSFLREKDNEYDPLLNTKVTQYLEIQVCNIRRLMKNLDERSCFVTVKVYGNTPDRKEFKTKNSGEGSPPFWGETLTIPLCCPEMCCILILLNDNNGLRGWFSLPVKAIQPGYHSIKLMRSETINRTLCYLLCSFTFRDVLG